MFWRLSGIFEVPIGLSAMKMGWYALKSDLISLSLVYIYWRFLWRLKTLLLAFECLGVYNNAQSCVFTAVETDIALKKRRKVFRTIFWYFPLPNKTSEIKCILFIYYKLSKISKTGIQINEWWKIRNFYSSSEAKKEQSPNVG